MRWIYKIYGGYDGFRPAAIESRIQAGRLISLGWAKYADVAERGDIVWVYFFEGSRFEAGVYVKGFVHEIKFAEKELVLRVSDYSTAAPLMDAATNVRIAEIVSPRKRQVFLLPGDLEPTTVCSVAAAGAPSCAARNCMDCSFWQDLPVVTGKAVNMPSRLPAGFARSHTPGYWIIPKRSFVHRSGRHVRAGVTRTTELFYRYKTGEGALAYPLASAIHRALAMKGTLDFDAIVPVPLSPEKAASGELHRALKLSEELGRILRVPVVDALRLKKPISRRVMMNYGATSAMFENKYVKLLDVDVAALSGLSNLLLVDDVCTAGHTFRAIAAWLHASLPDVSIHLASAGQMAVRGAVHDDDDVLD
jgi:hypothetical protein